MSKLDRKNNARQLRILKLLQHQESMDVFKGKDGAPRIVAVVPLCGDIAPDAVARCINDSLESNEHVPPTGPYLTHIDRFKQRVQYLPVSKDLFAALNACRVADYVLFVLSAEQGVDELGELILRSVESQGISNVYVAAQGVETIKVPKRRQQTLASLRSFAQHFLPTVDRIYSLDNRQECLHIIRSICTTTPSGVRWREDRSWMFAERVKWCSSEETKASSAEVVLTGVVRGQGLKADRLVHISDWGDFRIDQITAAPRSKLYDARYNSMAVDGRNQGDILERPTEDQDTMEELAPEEVVMDETDITPSLFSGNGKGVLLDDERYFSGHESDQDVERPRRLPKGTSKYQSAWYLCNESDSGSDMEDVEEWQLEGSVNGESTHADGMEGLTGLSALSVTDANDAASEYPQSDMFLDPSPEDAVEAEELAVYRAKRRKAEAEEDRQFPDEIELHPHVLARERLSKYRGLKSFKTSPWNTEADRPYQPDEWARLLDINDYRAAKSKVMRDSIFGGVRSGTRVRIHLKDVPLSLKEQYDPSKPLTLFSLLRHERKRTCVNASIILKSDAPQPLKSKGELVAQIGPRRFTINPLFSQAGATPNDVHKFERYLHLGRTAVASFIAPVTWGSIPVLFFQKRAQPSQDPDGSTRMDTSDPATPALHLVGTGTTLPSSTGRIIAKRAVLTGQPYKIHKKLVTIRYMFFNAEDVAWFKVLQLWTNRGKQGTIKESLGTHGYFKAVFEGRIGPQDAVAMSLYKRVWPRQARAFVP